MPDIEYIRAEIERMRIQVHRQRGEIKQLQRAGIPTASAEAARSDVEQHRSALRGARPAEKGTARPVQRESSGRASVVTMREPLQWYDHNADNPPRIKARAEVRQLAPREGWCYQHVQAIIVAIDPYAETARGYGSWAVLEAFPHPPRTECRHWHVSRWCEACLLRK